MSFLTLKIAFKKILFENWFIFPQINLFWILFFIGRLNRIHNKWLRFEDGMSQNWTGQEVWDIFKRLHGLAKSGNFDLLFCKIISRKKSNYFLWKDNFTKKIFLWCEHSSSELDWCYIYSSFAPIWYWIFW